MPELGWYVVRCTVGSEEVVRDVLLKSVDELGLQSQIVDVLALTEKTTEIRGGLKQEHERKMYSGYLMIRMIYSDATSLCVLATPGIGEFLSTSPMSEDEIHRMLMDKGPLRVCFPIKIEWGDRDK